MPEMGAGVHKKFLIIAQELKSAALLRKHGDCERRIRHAQTENHRMARQSQNLRYFHHSVGSMAGEFCHEGVIAAPRHAYDPSSQCGIQEEHGGSD